MTSTSTNCRPAVRTVAVSDVAWRRLRHFNLAAAALHAAQAAAMLALSTAVSLPVTALFASGPPGTPPQTAPPQNAGEPAESGIAGITRCHASGPVSSCSAMACRALSFQ